MTTTYDKPLPLITGDNKEFWEGLKRHELLIQRCADCKTPRMYPRPMCQDCGSMNDEFVKVSGKGTIYSYIIIRRAVHPAFKDGVPYAVVLVELDDAPGIRLPSNVTNCKPEELKIGMPVEVVFEDVTPEVTLPKFRVVTPRKKA